MGNSTQKKKKRLRNKADKLWYEKLKKDQCEVCGKPAVQVHHFYPKGAYSHLRYDLDNGISICQGCHMRHHSAGDPNIHQTVIDRRGEEWHTRLVEKARNRPESSYLGIGYYKDIIEKLS